MQISLEACEGLKIAILDIGSFASRQGFPSCNLSLVVVNSGDGTVYLSSEKQRLMKHAAGHELGSHAAPWCACRAVHL